MITADKIVNHAFDAGTTMFCYCCKHPVVDAHNHTLSRSKELHALVSMSFFDGEFFEAIGFSGSFSNNPRKEIFFCSPCFVKIYNCGDEILNKKNADVWKGKIANPLHKTYCAICLETFSLEKSVLYRLEINGASSSWLFCTDCYESAVSEDLVFAH